MPIDYLAQKQSSQQALDDLLSQRRSAIPGQLAQTGQNIAANRNAFMGGTLSDALGGISQTYGLSPSVAQAGRASAGVVSGKLARQTNTQLNEQKFNQDRSSVNLIYNNAVQKALNAGYDVNSAVQFARQTLADNQRRGFEASQNAVSRAQQLKLADIGDQYAQIGLQYETQAPQNTYEQALYRALAGTAAIAGTAYGMNKYNANQLQKQQQTLNYNNSFTPAPVSSSTSYGPYNTGGQYPLNPYKL